LVSHSENDAEVGVLGPRYGKVCHFLRPFVRFVYRACKCSGDVASVLLNDSAKLIIKTFPHYLMLGLYTGEGKLKLSRKMKSFLRRQVTKRVESDASLSSSGLLFFNILASEEEVPVASAVVDVQHLGFGVNASLRVSGWGVGEPRSQAVGVRR
jgi:hypothetical protein